MSRLDDINRERDAAIAILDRKLQAAYDLRNAGATGIDDAIDALAAQQAEVALQAYEAALDDPTMAAALATLRAAIANVASLGRATNGVVAALKGAG
jgi:hypothetical protein